MEPTPPRIEIFAPFGEAFELTKKILFQPFDFVKWLVIGFAAWLATFFSGGRFNYRSNPKDWEMKWKSEFSDGAFANGAPAWFIPVLIVVGIFCLVLILVVLWLNARGRFMFTDCIVRNRGAIAQPWREFRAEGNRYFVLQLVISLACILVFGGLALIYFMGSLAGNDVLPIAILIPFGLIFLLIAIPVAVIMKLAVPVMYRQRCDAMSAFAQVWKLMVANPVSFILFVLFYVVLCIAALMIGCLAACVTCCIAALPYVGTVLLLPVVMCLYSYPLCFLRQFGDAYDVWATIPAIEAPAVPPTQQPPPSDAPPPLAPPPQAPPTSPEPPTSPPPPPPPFSPPQ
jgi:hypothetical protein